MRPEKDEFIGEKIKVIESPQKNLVGLEGLVVDETKNTITIQVGEKNKKLLKDQIIFSFKGKKINGRTITLSSHERIKKTKKG